MKRKVITCFLVLALLCGNIGVVPTIQARDISYRNSVCFPKKDGKYKTVSIEKLIPEYTYGDPAEWVKSGIYEYEFLDKAKGYIALRRIHSTREVITIPQKIDGYEVLGVGVDDWGTDSYSEEIRDPYNGKVLQDGSKVKKVIIPNGVEYIGRSAFKECKNLESVTFPNSLVKVGYLAFSHCKVRKFALPYGVEFTPGSFSKYDIDEMSIYSDSELDDSSGEKLKGVCGSDENYKIRTLRIKYHKNKNYAIVSCWSLKNLYIDSKMGKITVWDSYFDDTSFQRGETLDITPKLVASNIYVNGKNTVLKLPYATDIYRIYTVPKAKAISFAKKLKVDYYVKYTGKSQTLVAAKTGEKYKAKWKKTTTKIQKYTYKKKWKKKTTTQSTKYKVYGKNKKKDSYQYITTTKKRSISTTYKYIKVKPVAIWE